MASFLATTQSITSTPTVPVVIKGTSGGGSTTLAGLTDVSLQGNLSATTNQVLVYNPSGTNPTWTNENFKLPSLGDVVVTTTPTAGNVLSWSSTVNSGNGGWTPSTVASSVTKLNQLTGDVDPNLDNASNGQVLTFQLSNKTWIASTPSGGTLALSGLTTDVDSSVDGGANGNFLAFNGGKWYTHSLVSADIPSLAESKITNLTSDLANKVSSVNSINPDSNGNVSLALNKLSDVHNFTEGSGIDKYFLSYDNSTGNTNWNARQLTTTDLPSSVIYNIIGNNGSLPVSSNSVTVHLADLTGVNISSPANGQLLTYNGSNWANSTSTSNDISISQTIATSGTFSVLYNDSNNESPNYPMISSTSSSTSELTPNNFETSPSGAFNYNHNELVMLYDGSVVTLPMYVNYYFNTASVINVLKVAYGYTITNYNCSFPLSFTLYGSNMSSSNSNRFTTSYMTQLFSETNILNNYTNSSVYNQSSTSTYVDVQFGNTIRTIQTAQTFNNTAYTTYTLAINQIFGYPTVNATATTFTSWGETSMFFYGSISTTTNQFTSSNFTLTCDSNGQPMITSNMSSSQNDTIDLTRVYLYELCRRIFPKVRDTSLLLPATSIGSPSNGQIWYDSSSNAFKFYQNGATVSLSGGSGATAMTGLTDVSITEDSSHDQYLLYWNWNGGSNSKWISRQIVATDIPSVFISNINGVNGSTHSITLNLRNINDCTNIQPTTSLINGQILSFSTGNGWVNSSKLLLPATTESSPSNGEIWYDSSSSLFKFRQNGNTVSINTGSVITSLSGLITDVSVNDSQTTDKQVLSFVGGSTNMWEAKTLTLSYISDVNINVPVVAGQLLTCTANSNPVIVNTSFSLTPSNSPSSTDVLGYNGNHNWINKTPQLTWNSDVALSSLQNKNLIKYNGTQWVNTAKVSLGTTLNPVPSVAEIWHDKLNNNTDPTNAWNIIPIDGVLSYCNCYNHSVNTKPQAYFGMDSYPLSAFHINYISGNVQNDVAHSIYYYNIDLNIATHSPQPTVYPSQCFILDGNYAHGVELRVNYTSGVNDGGRFPNGWLTYIQVRGTFTGAGNWYIRDMTNGWGNTGTTFYWAVAGQSGTPNSNGGSLTPFHSNSTWVFGYSPKLSYLNPLNPSDANDTFYLYEIGTSGYNASIPTNFIPMTLAKSYLFSTVGFSGTVNGSYHGQLSLPQNPSNNSLLNHNIITSNGKPNFPNTPCTYFSGMKFLFLDVIGQMANCITFIYQANYNNSLICGINTTAGNVQLLNNSVSQDWVVRPFPFNDGNGNSTTFVLQQAR